MFTGLVRRAGDQRGRKSSDPVRRRGGAAIVAAVAVFLAVMDIQNPAHAYLDPGTGSIILQLLLGGFAGALFVLKLYWHRFRSLFQRDRKKSQDATAPSRE